MNSQNIPMGQLVASYLSAGFTKSEAVRYIVAARMARMIAHGKGRNASRRIGAGVILRRAADPRDIAHDTSTESRSFNRLPRVNPHD